MSVGETLKSRLDPIGRRAILVGIVGLAIVALAGYFWPSMAFRCYLVAYIFWVGIGLGCVAITMLHHLVGGSWGMVIRRPMEAGAMTLVPLAVLFVPFCLGLPAIYEWARPEAAEIEVIRHKAILLNPTTYALISAGCFLIWIGFAFLLNRWSAQQDRTEDLAPSRRLQRLSGPGLAIVFLTGSFAAIEWMMSLEPRWYSSIYGPMVIVGWGLSTFAAMILIASILAEVAPMDRVATPARLQDLGNLMLAFVMLWAYMSFSQFLIIWSGNLVEEIPWYLRRMRGGWQYVAIALIAFHFFAPFFALLSRESKRRVAMIRLIAASILLMRVVDLSWLILPAFHDPEHATIPWVSLLLIPASLVGIGGIWTQSFVRSLASKPLIPLHDPGIGPAIDHDLDPQPAGGV